MKRYSQKEIAKRLIEVRDLMDFLDDGYHIEEYFNLVKISNGLFLRLNESNQKKFKDWVDKKTQERISEGA